MNRRQNSSHLPGQAGYRAHMNRPLVFLLSVLIISWPPVNKNPCKYHFERDSINSPSRPECLPTVSKQFLVAINTVVKIKQFLVVINQVVKIKRVLVVINTVVKIKQFLVVINIMVKIEQFLVDINTVVKIKPFLMVINMVVKLKKFLDSF